MSDGRLRWRCRRGMRELDELLGRWLERCQPTASSDELRAFERFLDLPDPDMARYLLGREPPPEEHRAIFDTLIRLAAEGERPAIDRR